MKTRTLLILTLLSTTITVGLTTPASAGGYDNRDVVHDERGNRVHSSFGGCVRTKWVGDSDECHPKPRMKPARKTEHHVVERNPIPDEDRTVYFGFDQSNLTADEAAKLDNLATQLKSMDDIKGVSIVGYADRIGSVSYNDRLSQKRAQVIENYLRKQGYLNTTVAKTQWLGKSASVTDCSNGLSRSALISCLHRDRRVTVEMQYKDDVSETITTY
jgi:outer membrane protein OmpA-like peptidoglycan-associated protein